MSKHKRNVKKYGSAKAAGITGRCMVGGCKKKAESMMIFAAPVPDGEVGGENEEKAFSYCWRHSYGMVVEELSQTRHRLDKKTIQILRLRNKLAKYEGTEEE